MTPSILNVFGQPFTHDPLFDRLYTRCPLFWLFSARPFKFSHILLQQWHFSYLFTFAVFSFSIQIFPVWQIFHQVVLILWISIPNGPHFVTFCTEWPPFFKSCVLNDPPFKRYIWMTIFCTSLVFLIFVGLSRRLYLMPETVSRNVSYPSLPIGSAPRFLPKLPHKLYSAWKFQYYSAKLSVDTFT